MELFMLLLFLTSVWLCLLSCGNEILNYYKVLEGNNLAIN